MRVLLAHYVSSVEVFWGFQRSHRLSFTITKLLLLFNWDLTYSLKKVIILSHGTQLVFHVQKLLPNNLFDDLVHNQLTVDHQMAKNYTCSYTNQFIQIWAKLYPFMNNCNQICALISHSNGHLAQFSVNRQIA